MQSRKIKRLSSILTIVYKFIFPAAWLLGFGFGVLRMLINNHPRGLFFAAITIVGCFVFLLLCFPLKMVWVGEDYLIVSNFFKKIKIPLHSIDTIRENKWINTKNVTIDLKTDTEFGQHIVFMPCLHFGDIFNLWSDSSTTKFLKEKLKEYQKGTYS